MAMTLYYMSGSPYAWRVWLALEHKGMAYDLKRMSFDAGDFSQPSFLALNPRHQVPVIVDGDFVLYESAAIVEYLEDKQPEPRLFATDLRERAVQRRLVREADEYVAEAIAELARAVLFTPRERWSEERIGEACAAIKRELAMWEGTVRGEFITGDLSVVDFSLFPHVALLGRIGDRFPGLLPGDLAGPNLRAWMQRVQALPIMQETWPPHWKA
jgi:glutathione S-transferase